MGERCQEPEPNAERHARFLFHPQCGLPKADCSWRVSHLFNPLRMELHQIRPVAIERRDPDLCCLYGVGFEEQDVVRSVRAE
jgi:hypothetical protein